MNPDEFVLLNQYGPIIIGQGELSEFDASANAGLFVYAPRWPLLASAPATVVNGQRFRLAEAGREFGREYLGVGGVWVAQASVTMGVWLSNGIEWVVQDGYLVTDTGDLIVLDNGDSIVVDDQNAVISLDANGFINIDVNGYIERMV